MFILYQIAHFLRFLSQRSGSRMSKCEVETKLEGMGQSHLLRFYEELTEEQRKQLIDQINGFDLERVSNVFKEYAQVKPDDVSKLAPIDPDHYASVNALSKDDLDRYWQTGAVLVLICVRCDKSLLPHALNWMNSGDSLTTIPAGFCGNCKVGCDPRIVLLETLNASRNNVLQK